MQTAITRKIRVSVQCLYQAQYSNPLRQEFVHAYRIEIHNLGPHTVQLLTRKWEIWDSNGFFKEVEGEGVVGQQPVLPPQESHAYVSGCHLHTEIGYMQGHYTFLNQDTQEHFEVAIPRFELLVPFKFN